MTALFLCVRIFNMAQQISSSSSPLSKWLVLLFKMPPQGRTLPLGMGPFYEKLKSNVRLTQILIMAGLLGAGVWFRDFSLMPAQVLATFVAGLGVQAFWIKRLKLKQVGYLSAIITCFGVSLLLRADHIWAHPLAVSVAISAKFLIRYREKHLFNPANLAVIFSLLVLPGTWVSSGQWGQDLIIASWLIALGALVAGRAKSFDISWSFILIYGAMVIGRNLYLGNEWAITLHHFRNGALLLFTFFMISDPKTIPNHQWGRWAHSFIVALFAFIWQFYFYHNNGVLWGLFLLSPIVCVWDHIFPAKRFKWGLVENHTNNN